MSESQASVERMPLIWNACLCRTPNFIEGDFFAFFNSFSNASLFTKRMSLWNASLASPWEARAAQSFWNSKGIEVYTRTPSYFRHNTEILEQYFFMILHESYSFAKIFWQNIRQRCPWTNNHNRNHLPFRLKFTLMRLFFLVTNRLK